MITFDQNGVATPESQMFFDQKRLEITQRRGIDDAAKGSMLRDLYNQYGMVFGTYNRMNATRYAKDDAPAQSYSSGGDGFSANVWVVLFIAAVLGMGFVDQWLASSYNIHIGYINAVGNLISWIFSSH